MQSIVPRIVIAVTQGCEAVVGEAQMLCPVGSTGELVGSIHTASVAVVGTTVQGSVVADAPHAGFVEFGTGTEGAGTYPYELPESGVPYTNTWQYDFRNQDWKGHEAQPFMRPAVDTAAPEIRAAFEKQGFKV